MSLLYVTLTILDGYLKVLLMHVKRQNKLLNREILYHWNNQYISCPIL